MVKSISQLSAIIETFPWCASARAALCRRLSEESGYETAKGLFKDSIPYLPDAGFVAAGLKKNAKADFSDAELAEKVRDLIDARARIVMTGQDFFSREEYESATLPEDAELHRIAVTDASKFGSEQPTKDNAQLEADFWANAEDGSDLIPSIVTESLAQIFAEQGYPDKAIKIYKKLSLQSPEKSAYFAVLIERLNEKTKN